MNLTQLFRTHPYSVELKLKFNGTTILMPVEVNARHSFQASLLAQEVGFAKLREMSHARPELEHTALVSVISVERVSVETAVAA